MEDICEFVHEPLTFEAKQEMFKLVLGEIRSPADIAPKLRGGYVLFFFSHNLFDSIGP
jgi:hypothetical protein